MKRLMTTLGAFILASTPGCRISQFCFSDSECPSPKVCGSSGTCVWRCDSDGECGPGFTCREHVCEPVPVVKDTGPDGTDDVVQYVCPEDMVMVAGSYCVDRHEAARPDATAFNAGTDDSKAFSCPDVLPWKVADNPTAQAACEAVGKRLCTPEEWELACRGPEGTVYGYGDKYEPETCNGIDTFGEGLFHLEVTGALSGCTNGWGVFDMNGNLWEHVLGGDGTTIRGGAYNCADSRTLHRCDYIPGSWKPSARGFRCCRALVVEGPDEGSPDTVEPMPDAWQEVPDAGVDAGETENPGCIDEDQGPGDPGPADIPAGDPGSGDTGPGKDVPADEGVASSCPPDMVPIQYGPDAALFCMDRYEASHGNATDKWMGDSAEAASQAGVIPWYSVTLDLARSACQAAGKRLCTPAEWFDACRGTTDTVYTYGDDYLPAVCNGIDTFCLCDSPACSLLEECPYPHCYKQATPDGTGGPCGAAFHVMPTGAFPDCVNEWGVFDVNGNVWEVVDTDDGLEHFRGGAYNCANSEALHRCDHDGSWGPSARGFRCCRDADVLP